VWASGLSFSLGQDAIRSVVKLSDSGHFRKTVPAGESHPAERMKDYLPARPEACFWPIWQLFGSGDVELSYEGMRR